MTEEVEIKNVGGDKGVASEVTLAKLVTAMEKMASTTGIDPKSQAAKAEKARTVSIEKGIKESTKHRAATKNNTKALKDNTKYLKLMGSGLLKLIATGIDSVTDSLLGLSQELLGTSRQLSDFTRHLPIVGGGLSALTGIMDESFDAFQSLAKSGATFGYSLENLRNTAADARMSLEEFSEFVQNNTQRFAEFGGTVDQGIKNISRLRDTMGTDLTNRFRELGITGEEINEQLATQLYLNRAGARTRNTTDAQYLASTLALTENMATLAKLTGEDIKSQQEKIAQAQMDVAFQRELNKLDEDERKKVNAAMAEAMAAGGPAAVEALQAQFLGMPPLTEAAQLYTTTQTEGAELMRQNLDTALNSAISYDDYMLQRESRMSDYGEAYANAAQRLDSILRAEAAGLEGIGIAEQMMQSQRTFGAYIDSTGRFVRDEFRRTFEGLDDTDPSDEDDDELSAITRFRTAIDDARHTITENLINPLLNVATEVLNPFTQWFSDFTADETGEGSKFSQALSILGDYLNNTVARAVRNFFTAFAEDPMQAIRDAFSNISNAMTTWFFGDLTESGERMGGFYNNHLAPLLQQLGSDLMQGAWEVISNGLSNLFTNPVVVGGLVAAIGLLFGAGMVKRSLANAFSDSFLDRRGLRSSSSSGGSRGGLRGGGRWRTIGRALSGIARVATSAPALGATLALTPTEMGDGTLDGAIERSGLSEEEFFSRLDNQMSQGGPALDYIQQQMSAIQSLQDNINRSLSGENVYWGRDRVGREEDQTEINRLTNTIEQYAADTLANNVGQDVSIDFIRNFARFTDRIPEEFSQRLLEAESRIEPDTATEESSTESSSVSSPETPVNNRPQDASPTTIQELNTIMTEIREQLRTLNETSRRQIRTIESLGTVQ